jgi:hypothetical protein
LSAPKEILELVRRFEEHRESYLSGHYNETQLRREFMDPFFEALGWDVNNRQGWAESYKEVIHEDSIKISGSTKAPDYCFRIGQDRKFFVEAKKPSVKLKDEAGPAFQLRRYGWNTKLPMNILTDFEEFAVYDCRIRPNQNDKASTARVSFMTYRDYPEKWNEIAGVFSKEAVLKGGFDRFADERRLRKGTLEVDDAFLAEIEGWREKLARNIALRNPSLTTEELNFSVQRTIDRIIFLRICEDRGIEEQGRLRQYLNGANIYRRLVQFFRSADDRYNSGIFHFQTEKDRAESPDNLTPELIIDDRVLQEILSSLYTPSPYDFSIIPADILGQVYEQFLGKVIRLTEGHHAKVEEKPEVRKAGGVYYTPTYIVDYIVKNTVGKLLEGKTPKEVSGLKGKNARPLRILDPACGSGSFLLGAYQYLINWYRDWYVKDSPQKWASGKTPVLYRFSADEWRLTSLEKKRILLTHIYGVDIDSQAVEVTKLSLLLKVLENETDESVKKQLQFFRERALPDLGNNIKCGNSLIGPDFDMSGLSDEERRRINPFDWEREFPIIMNSGGFDAVIGNPPYVLLQDDFRDDEQLRYFRQKYKGASYKLDTYHLFIEQGISLCKTNGKISLITPSNFLTNNYLDGLRRIILQKTQPEEIIVIEGGVFTGVSVNNAVFVLLVGQAAKKPFRLTRAIAGKTNLKPTSQDKVFPKRVLTEERALFTSGIINPSSDLWDRLSAKYTKLGLVADVNFGKQLRDRKKFPSDVIEVTSQAAIPRTHVACVTGKDIERYFLDWSRLACLNSDIAQRGGCWDQTKHNAKNKLLTRQIGRYPYFALDHFGYHCLNTLFMVTPFEAINISPQFLLGLLNSKLIQALWVARFYDQRKTFPKIKGTYLKELPIALPDLSRPADKARHDRMVKLVEEMLELHKKLPAARTDHDKTLIQRQIESTDQQIDRLVYDLYGLTEAEIKLVEESGKGK